jgi:nucleoside-diphosphate-sugar epimerase
MITVLGGSGFIGHRLCDHLRAVNVEHCAPSRNEPLEDRALGDVIYCIGLTADFRKRACDTVEAHVAKLLSLLRDCTFDSVLYLSSTRVYRPSERPAREEDALQVEPLVPGDLYNTSKLMGESLCLNSGRTARIARLSNVYGNDFFSENFLASLVRDAVTQGRVTLQTSPDSVRDYIDVARVVEGLVQIALRGRHEIYNVASGRNVSHRDLTARLQQLTGCAIEFAPDAPKVRLPPITIERMKAEFDFRGSNLLDDLEGLVNSYQQHLRTDDQR